MRYPYAIQAASEEVFDGQTITFEMLGGLTIH
jgi:hypothetical protein